MKTPRCVGAKGAFPEGKIAQDVQAVIDTQLIFRPGPAGPVKRPSRSPQ
jgi:hypothetical protein